MVSGASNMTRRVVDHWQQRNVTLRAAQTLDRIASITPDTIIDGGGVDDAAAATKSVFAHPVLTRARRKLRVVVDAGAKAAHDANTYVLGAAGVSSNTNPCDSEFSVVCLHCKILDNIGKLFVLRPPSPLQRTSLTFLFHTLSFFFFNSFD
jgi:hypothetical protein